MAPDLNENGTKVERKYRVEGKQSLSEENWADITDIPNLATVGWRFFRVKVALPEE